VRCKTCEAYLWLADVVEDEKGKITFYVVPLEPIPCKECGSSHLYSSADAVRFRVDDEPPSP
jgi:hypothetical protein